MFLRPYTSKGYNRLLTLKYQLLYIKKKSLNVGVCDKTEPCCYWFESHLTFKCEVCVYMTHCRNELFVFPAKEGEGVECLISVRTAFAPRLCYGTLGYVSSSFVPEDWQQYTSDPAWMLTV